jgi:transcription elongation factor Elf1
MESIPSKQYYKYQVKRQLREYKKTIACARCGESHWAALDFHHEDPAEKDDAVSHLVNNGYSWARVKAEIDKCTVLCANCHRKHHATAMEASEWRWHSMPEPLVEHVPHGPDTISQAMKKRWQNPTEAMKQASKRNHSAEHMRTMTVRRLAKQQKLTSDTVFD